MINPVAKKWLVELESLGEVDKDQWPIVAAFHGLSFRCGYVDPASPVPVMRDHLVASPREAMCDVFDGLNFSLAGQSSRLASDRTRHTGQLEQRANRRAWRGQRLRGRL